MSEMDKDSTGKKEMFGFRAAKPLAKEIKRFAEENEMSKSDALKTLVREGLEADALRDELEEMGDQMEQLSERVEEMEQQSLWDRLF
jgi:urease accessory protein UreF